MLPIPLMTPGLGSKCMLRLEEGHQGGRWLDRYQELSNLLIPHLSSLWMYADVVLTDRHAVQVVPWRP